MVDQVIIGYISGLSMLLDEAPGAANKLCHPGAMEAATTSAPAIKEEGSAQMMTIDPLGELHGAAALWFFSPLRHERNLQQYMAWGLFESGHIRLSVTRQLIDLHMGLVVT